MGELHLEITVYRLEEEQGIKVKVSEPIVVYRESVQSDNKEGHLKESLPIDITDSM